MLIKMADLMPNGTPIDYRIQPIYLLPDSKGYWHITLHFYSTQWGRVLTDDKSRFPVFDNRSLNRTVQFPNQPTNRGLLNSIVWNWPINWPSPKLSTLKTIVKHLRNKRHGNS